MSDLSSSSSAQHMDTSAPSTADSLATSDHWIDAWQRQAGARVMADFRKLWTELCNGPDPLQGCAAPQLTPQNDVLIQRKLRAQLPSNICNNIQIKQEIKEEELEEEETRSIDTSTIATKAEAHLSTFSHALAYVDRYVRTLWVFGPMHPVSVHSDSISLLLSNGSEDGSLLRNTDHASPAYEMYAAMGIAAGAILLGDLQVEMHFLKRTENIFNALYSCKDERIYDINAAVVALGLCWFYLPEDPLRATAFLRAAMYICEVLDALNSDLYYRCLYSLSLISLCTTPDTFRIEEGSSRVISATSEVQRAGGHRYRPISELNLAIVPVESFEASSFPVPLTTLQATNRYLAILTNITKAITAMTGPGFDSSQSVGVANHLINYLDKLEEEIVANQEAVRGSMTKLPELVYAFFHADMAVLKAKCFTVLGRYQEAADFALQTLRHFEQPVFIRTMPMLVIPRAPMLLEVLIDSGQSEAAESLIRIFVELSAKPFYATLCDRLLLLKQQLYQRVRT